MTNTNVKNNTKHGYVDNGAFYLMEPLFDLPEPVYRGGLI